MADFKAKFEKDAGMQTASLTAAIEQLGGGEAKADPVNKFFTDTLAGVDLSGKAAAKADGSVSEKLAFAQQQAEAEFVKSFYVTADEAKAVKAAVKDEAALEDLMKKVYAKVGFHLPSMYSGVADLKTVGDAAADKFVGEVNAAKAKLAGDIKKQSLSNFSASFA